MTPAIHNACILAIAALAVAWLAHKRLSARGKNEDNDEGLFPEGADPHEFLQKRYAVKTRFRLGVLAFSLGAVAVYLVGGGRIFAVLLLACAGLCQYGAMRQKTAVRLSEALRRKFS